MRSFPILTLALSATAFAQSTGRITGTVFGLAGDKVTNAPIQARNVVTKEVYKATSSDKGGYTLTSLPAGPTTFRSRYPLICTRGWMS